MRYLKLFSALFRHSVKRYLEDRANTLGFMSLMWLNFLVQIYLIQIMFTQTKAIAGWSREEVFLILGLSRLFGTVFSLLFQRSINHLTGEITEGNLDLILTKPFSSQFYFSFYLLRAFELINLLLPIALITYALFNLTSTFSIISLFLMVLLMICGVVIFYSIYIMIATATFWAGKFSSFPSIFNIFTIPLSVPTDIYGRNFNFLITFVVPLGFVVTIPAKVLLGKLDGYYIFFGIIFAGFFLYLSNRLWNIALRNYSSASS